MMHGQTKIKGQTESWSAQWIHCCYTTSLLCIKESGVNIWEVNVCQSVHPLVCGWWIILLNFIWMGGACGAYGGGVYRVLLGKPEGKRPLGRPRRRWEDNIKMDLQEVGGGCGDWMELAQDRDRWRALVSTVMNLRVPKIREISWLAAEPVSFSRRTLFHGVSK